jgi:hypothetical protein
MNRAKTPNAPERGTKDKSSTYGVSTKTPP